MRIIRSGCYIDFEGFAGNEHQSSPPPVLIGILRDGQFRQVVFTKQYRWAAEESGVEHEVEFCSDRAAFLKELVATVKGSSPLFAYSEHERTVIENQVGHKITKRYRNVRSIASRWFNQQRDGHPKPETNALRDVAETLEIPMIRKLKVGGVTERLRKVSSHSSSEKKWTEAPKSIRAAWREVLEHNRCDVEATFEIMKRLRSNTGR